MTEINAPGPSGAGPAPGRPPRKRRRVFRWIFLAVQVLFLIWIITGATSASHASCDPNLSQQACTAAKQVGGGIGVFLIIFLWVAVDVILGIGYLIFRKR